jgi:ATP-dependent Clp protease ATP-binding subunit ClpA
MFERFTDQARGVVDAARDEARLMHHAHIGTEHLLVGLARGEDEAAALLHRYGLTGERARAEVVRMVGMGTDGDTEPPFTPAARDALELTLSEAMRLGHERADAAHLLLAILRQRDALARRILLGAGAAPRDVRAELIRGLDERPRAVPQDPSGAVVVRLDETVVGDLGHPNVDGRLLLEILERRGAVAAWLRERGVDEAAVRRMLGR